MKAYNIMKLYVGMKFDYLVLYDNIIHTRGSFIEVFHTHMDLGYEGRND